MWKIISSFIGGFLISLLIFKYKTKEVKEIWAVINKFLKDSFRGFLKKKIIDNLISYTLYFLIILSSIYALINLTSKSIKHLKIENKPDEFPFVLEFSEYIFLYFLPIFILFGILNFYKLEWKRQLGNSNKTDPNAANKLNLSKKLFFTSVFSYMTLKIIDILFFDYVKYTFNSFHMISIGVFFILILLFIVLTSKRH